MDAAEPNPIARRVKLQEILEGYKTFTQTLAFVHWIASRQAECDCVKDQIISCEPKDRDSELEALKLRGDLRTNEEFTTIFQDTISNLTTTIEQLLEAEQQTDTAKTK